MEFISFLGSLHCLRKVGRQTDGEVIGYWLVDGDRDAKCGSSQQFCLAEKIGRWSFC